MRRPLGSDIITSNTITLRIRCQRYFVGMSKPLASIVLVVIVIIVVVIIVIVIIVIVIIVVLIESVLLSSKERAVVLDERTAKVYMYSTLLVHLNCLNVPVWQY